MSEDTIPVTEHWILTKGFVYLIRNGQIAEQWPEAEAPIVFVNPTELLLLHRQDLALSHFTELPWWWNRGV